MVCIGGGCVCSIFVQFVTIVICIVVKLVIMYGSVMVYGVVLMFVGHLMLLNVCVLSMRMYVCIVSLCSGCDGCCSFVLF